MNIEAHFFFAPLKGAITTCKDKKKKHGGQKFIQKFSIFHFNLVMKSAECETEKRGKGKAVKDIMAVYHSPEWSTL